MNGSYVNGYGGYGSTNGSSQGNERRPGPYGGLSRLDPHQNQSPSPSRYARPPPLRQFSYGGSPDARSRSGNREGPATRQIEEVLAYIKREWSFMLENNCVPVHVASQLLDESSLGLANRYDEFQQTQNQLQNALRAIVNEHHQGFNSSIGTFHQIQASIQASHDRIRNLKDELVQAKSNLSTANPEWTRLIGSSQNYSSMLDDLTTIEQIQEAPEKLEASISEKRFLTAVELLQDSLRLIRRPEMEDINALSDITVYISNQEHSLTDILIEELHNHLYLKSPYCEDRWLNYTTSEGTSARDGPLADYHPLVKFLDELDASISIPMTEDSSRNPETDSFHYIRVVTESLARLGRLDEAVDSIEERLPIELFKVVERSNNEVNQRYPSATRKAAARARTSLILEDPLKRKDQSAILHDLLEALYAKFEAIAESHRVFHDVVAGVSTRDGSTSGGNQRLTRGFKGLWQLYQSEMRSLLHDYLSTGGGASQRSGQALTGESNIFRYQRERNKKCNFKLSSVDTSSGSTSISSDIKHHREELVNTFEKFVPGLVSLTSASNSSTSHMTAATSSGQILSADSTAAGHKLLVLPSVFNIGVLLPPSVLFLNRLKAIVPPSSDIVVSTLSSFLNDFLINVFHPQLEETLIDYCSQSFIQLDSFQIDPNWAALAQKPLFKGTVKFFNIVGAFCKMLDDLTHDQIFSQLLINQMNSYYDRCAAWYKTLVTRATSSTAIDDTTNPSNPASQNRHYKAAAHLAEDSSITALITSLWASTSAGSSSSTTSVATTDATLSTTLLTHTTTSPLTESTLITDSKSQTHLCLIYTSLTWLALKLSRYRQISARATNSSSSSMRDSTLQPSTMQRRLTNSLPERPQDEGEDVYIPLNKETASLFDSILGSYKELASLALRTLHLEFRCRVLQRLSDLFSGSLIYTSSSSNSTAEPETQTPDESVLLLVSDLLAFDTELKVHLQQREHTFIVRGIMTLVDELVLHCLRTKVTGINKAGQDYLQLNARVLYRNLINVEPEGKMSKVFEFGRLFDEGSSAILANGKAASDVKADRFGRGDKKGDGKPDLNKEELRACLKLWYSDATSSADPEAASRARMALERGLKELG
ncbi:MAG: hypothetical protein M1828_006395 [Chrysothrix sp. TS-e1954]|nr:MAG: hypothetical protein M1828_006395 [Chrysothrix sp. TS-e1954]